MGCAMTSPEPVKPLISVITVTFNALFDLRTTCRSVYEQDFTNYEHIIVDGNSQDGTKFFLEGRCRKNVRYVSEDDNGIYHAMNKGINLANGEWIIFMNAGDSFVSKTTLSECSKYMTSKNETIIYGDHIVVYSDGAEKFVEARDIASIWKGLPFCHQSCFVQTQYIRHNPFSVENTIASDFKFFYQASQKGLIFRHVPQTVALYQAGGISDQKRIKSIIERWKVIDKSFLTAVYYSMLIAVETLKTPIKYILRLIRK